MTDYRCPYGYGLLCLAPNTNCPHWQGTFCELEENEIYVNREEMLERFDSRAKLTVGDKRVGVDSIRAFIENAPVADVVSREAYEQVRWERDVAIEQLSQIGKGFGEKMDDVAPERRGQWINVNDKLPKAEEEVFAVCNRSGFRFVVPAIYEDGTIPEEDSCWNWYELSNFGILDEEKDCYIIPKSWWENRQFTPDDVYNSQIDCEITHWMPLPELPKMDGGV